MYHVLVVILDFLVLFISLETAYEGVVSDGYNKGPCIDKTS
jgi:hypothetical protein